MLDEALRELRAECGAVQVSAGLRIKTVQLSLRKQQRMAGLDEGILQLSLPILVYTENPY